MLALGAAAALSLTGCGAHDSTGQISVTVSSNAADRPYEVKVFAATGKLSEHQRVFPGGTADFAGVPLGDVTVRAGDLCSVRTMVSGDDVTRVTLSTTRLLTGHRVRPTRLQARPPRCAGSLTAGRAPRPTPRRTGRARSTA